MPRVTWGPPSKTASQLFVEAFMESWEKAGKEVREKERLKLEKERVGIAKETAEATTEYRKKTLELAETEAERDLITQAFKLTKERRDVPMVGTAYIHKEDVTRNLQMLRTLQTTAETAEDDLTTFIENAEEREALKKTNPLVYKQFLQRAQAQGKLTEIKIEKPVVEERPPAVERRPILPPTAPREARGAEAIGARARPFFGAYPYATPSPEMVAPIQRTIQQLPSQIAGLGATGYNVLAGGLTGLTGIPQQTIPQEYLDLMRRGQLFQQPLEGIQQTGQALGAGVGVAGDYYRNLIQRLMQGQGVR